MVLGVAAACMLVCLIVLVWMQEEGRCFECVEALLLYCEDVLVANIEDEQTSDLPVRETKMTMMQRA
jgi:hypothetical protein